MGRSGSSSSTTCWTYVVGIGGGVAYQWASLPRSRLGGHPRGIVGVEPERSNGSRWRSSGNEIVTIQPQSVADGLGAPFAGRWTLAITRRLVHDIVLLDDGTILAGLRFALERLKQVVELAAAALAAVLAGGSRRTASVSLSSCRVATSR